MKVYKLGGLVLALLLSGAAAATRVMSDEEKAAMADFELAQQPVREATTAVFLQLRSSSAPRDWMLASQLQPLAADDPATSGAARAELLRNAAAAAPDDVLVQWVALMAMPQAGGGCGAPQSLPANMDRVLQLETDNGLAWLPVLEQARRDGDALDIDAALARMATATRYHDHVTDYAGLLRDLYAANPELVKAKRRDMPSAQSVDMTALLAMMDAAHLRPSLNVLEKVCGPGDQLPEPGRSALCADVGQRLLGENSLREAGLKLLRGNTGYEAQIQAAKLEKYWLLHSLSQSVGNEQAILGFTQELLRSGDELEAMRKAVKALGLPLTPPPLWQPPQELIEMEQTLEGDAEELEVDDTAEPAAAAAEDAQP